MKENVKYLLLLLILFLPATAHAWCWVRDTRTTSFGCPSGQYRQRCCSGNLRLWPSAAMDIAISTSTPVQFRDAIEEGVELWNRIEMSTFRFNITGTTSLNSVKWDNTSIIAIDPNFNQLGEGILAVSTTWTSGYGSNFRATESDIVFNGADYRWGDGTGETYSIKAVVAHETGHNAGISHAGAHCQNPGSTGCGANFQEATMYWNYSAGNTGRKDKSSLELDDVAAMIHGYPQSRFKVKVLDSNRAPVTGARVELLDAAAPVNGNSVAQGGQVYGDVTNPIVLLGDKAPSNSYINQTPFTLTDAEGTTNTVHPTRRNIRIQVNYKGASKTVSHTLVNGASTLEVMLPAGESDTTPPLLNLTSHTTNQHVTGNSHITLTGTATDSQRGDSGVGEVSVNGQVISEATAIGAQSAAWSLNVDLQPGQNTFTVMAKDTANPANTATQALNLTYSALPPEVTIKMPSPSSSGVSVNTSVSARFNRSMRASSLTHATFTCGQGISGRVTYDAASQTATFTPSTSLASGTTYTFILTTGVQDASGTPLSAPVSWSFTTQTPLSSSKTESEGCFIQSIGF